MKQCTYRTSISEEHGVFRWNQGAFGQILAKGKRRDLYFSQVLKDHARRFPRKKGERREGLKVL